MKAVFSFATLSELDQILAYTAAHFPSQTEKLEQHIRKTITRIEAMPYNARELERVSATRVLPLIRYPYKIFYRIEDERIFVLHIHHTARRPWRG